MQRVPMASVAKPAITPPPKPPEEEDVHRGQRRAHASEPVRHDGVQHGPTIANAAVMSTDCGMPRITNHARAVDGELQGREERHDGAMSAPTIANALAGFCRYTLSKYLATNGRIGSEATPPETEQQAPIERIGDLEVLLEVERRQRGVTEEAETSAQNAIKTVRIVLIFFSRANAASSRSARFLFLDDLAEHVLLLELTPRWFLHEEGADGHDRHGVPRAYQAQRQPSAPPAQPAIAATRTGLRMRSGGASLHRGGDIRRAH